MTLHRLQTAARELMDLTSAKAWPEMSSEQKREALRRAQQIEGRIRDMADLHNQALRTTLRKHHGVPRGQPLHMDKLPYGEVAQEFLEEIELLPPERYMDPKPDEAVRGLPENVAYFQRLGKHVHDQAWFLGVKADMLHERRRDALRESDGTDTYVQGLA